MDKYQRDVKYYKEIPESIILLFKGVNITAIESYLLPLS